MKPFSEACEQNKGPILEVLREVFAGHRRVLEIGSGTGQHAAYLPAHLPGVTWQPSDRRENLAGIALWLAEAALPNVPDAVELDVNAWPWPVTVADGVFSANTAHIMDEAGVAAMFAGVGRVLEPGGAFALYGPFSYGGHHTSASNARFDAWLRERDPAMGVRAFEHLDGLARDAGLEPAGDYAMPANNRTLVWRRPP